MQSCVGTHRRAERSERHLAESHLARPARQYNHRDGDHHEPAEARQPEHNTVAKQERHNHGDDQRRAHHGSPSPRDSSDRCQLGWDRSRLGRGLP